LTGIALQCRKPRSSRRPPIRRRYGSSHRVASDGRRAGDKQRRCRLCAGLASRVRPIIPPLVGGIRYEFAHRVFAATVSILTLVLAVWLARSGTRIARKLGWTALALIIAQALLGALRVLRGHPAVTATMHATLAQIFFVTVVSLALLTSAWWQRDLRRLTIAARPACALFAVVTTAAIFVQLILGAGFRHGAFGILPHLVGFVVVTFLIVWTCRAVRKRFGQVRDLRRWGVLLQAFLGTQILLGVAAYWAVVQAMHATQPSMAYVVITVAHVLVGALTLASSVVLTLSCYRLIRPKAVVALRSAMETTRTGGTRAESSRLDVMSNERAFAINLFEKPWAYVVLTKPDVTFLVVITTVAGFYLGSTGPVDWARLAQTLFGTLLVAGGTAALNQYVERDMDAGNAQDGGAPAPDRDVKTKRSPDFRCCHNRFRHSVAALTVNALAAFIAFATSASYLASTPR